MGLVKKDTEGKGKEAKDAKEEKEEKKEEEKPEDPPVVKKLKEVDDKYLELEKEYEREAHKLMLQFAEKQRPLLEERKRILTEAAEGDAGDAGAGPATGTPALSGFWLQAMQNHPNVEDIIQEWDEPVLEFLQDVEKVHMDTTSEEGEDTSKHFKLIFRFAENPYFTNTELDKEYNIGMSNPYCGQAEVKAIKCSTIEWKAGKDVTVEKVANKKKTKGGGAKKAKAKKEKEEPRPSFFRDFFRNLTPGVPLAEDARELALSMAEEEDEDDADIDDDNLIAYLMDGDYDVGTALSDNIIPFAVRWYTGEAAPDLDDDDEDDDDEDDEEEDDDEDDDDSEDEAPPPLKAKGGAKKSGKPKGSPETKPGEAPKEECKQQ